MFLLCFVDSVGCVLYWHISTLPANVNGALSSVNGDCLGQYLPLSFTFSDLISFHIFRVGLIICGVNSSVHVCRKTYMVGPSVYD